MLICLDGTFLPREEAAIPINDGGFLFGDTLFETLKARRKKIFLRQQHLDRLQQSARVLDFPCDRHKIELSLQQMAAALQSPASRIRLTLSRGDFTGLAWPLSSQARFLITATEYIELTDDERQAGVACIIAPNQRVNPASHLPQMKRGNYIDCLYAANYARQTGAREALFIDQQQNILEGTTSNLFAIIDDRLVTPPIGSLILNGIMRQQVIKTAAELGIHVVERELPFMELMQAEEIFLTNSLFDIFPVASIDGQPVNRGDCWKSLLKTLWMRIDT
ncbi:MAG: aminotransferase class IV [Desulfuromusa sp.]|jgi:branched-subunit amino acid aminotransferase/4-amino-4-deoxychorismate lyase|nr:aminotransferase class IV [Desulfuromusa sp.]